MPFLLAACHDSALEQRAEEIRQLSDREDRMYAQQAVAKIRHDYWTLRDHSWLGKLPDGAIISLDSPHAAAAPLMSRDGQRGWHLQLTITSDDCHTYPPSTVTQPFQAVYAITRYSETNWDIEVTDGPVTTPLQRIDALRLQGSE
ncbi:MAG: hypothetical protein ABSE62_10170 [Chthoniobacteraceae bacterium]|jgi:hypothetical protein